MKILRIALLAAAFAALPAADFTKASLGEELKSMQKDLDHITVDGAKAFFKKYVDPAELPEFDKHGGMDTIAQAFVDNGKAAILTDVLKAADLATATVDDANKTISFPPPEDHSHPALAFHFSDGHWYLKN
jgi:hypothetical protein